MASDRPPTEPISPGSPTAPTSPTSPKLPFLDEPDVLEWLNEWEQRNSTMDRKHVEVLCSQWQLMRESAKEHSHLIHQMKQAICELCSNGMTLQERFDDVERRLRGDIHQERVDSDSRMEALERRLRDETQRRLEDLERKLGERLDRLQSSQSAESRRNDERYGALQDAVVRERQEREAVLRDRLGALERLQAETAERHAAQVASLREELAGEKARREQDRLQRQQTAERVLDKFDGKMPASEEEVAGLKELITRERLAREMHDRSLQDMIEQGLATQEGLIGRETQAREAALEAMQRALGKERDVLREVKSYLTDETSARERSQASLQERVELLARLLADCTQKQASLLSAWETNLEKFQEMLEQERAARVRDLNATREALERERTAREVHVRTLQDLFEKEAEMREAGDDELKGDLACEREAREKHCEALRAALETIINRHEVSVQERVDQILALLHGSSNSMLQHWQDEMRRILPPAPAGAS